MNIRITRNGLRLSQHGIVISELRTTAGPTHSVFDVLASLISLFGVKKKMAVLGFAGGGMMAPLKALGVEDVVESVDLDRESYQLFRKHCPTWSRQVIWHHGEALSWLRSQRSKFDLIMDDLSIPADGDVTKPDISWQALPQLMSRKLRKDGIAIVNVLSPPSRQWTKHSQGIARFFPESRWVHFEEYENRVLIAGRKLPSSRELGKQLRESLRRLQSRQADRIAVRSLSGR